MTLELKKIPLGIFLFYGLALVLLFLTCCGKEETIDQDEPLYDYELATKEEIQEDYNLEANHVFQSTYITSLNDLSVDTTIFVYIGNPTCKFCKSNITLFNTLAKEYNIDIVYYIDSKKTSSDDLQDFKSNHNLNSLGVPFIFAIKDNQIIDHSEKDDYEELSWEETIPFLFSMNKLNDEEN